ncbi:hypothetical protein A9Q92_05760 [Methylophaga sp. 42_8_T64]|nr:hypothetical protein A9Q92_05760 [Methylophaga sp. 42_8_T64]
MNTIDRNHFKVLYVFICCFCLLACSDNNPKLTQLSDDAVILAFGDSLTFGMGADNSQTQSYPAVLQQLTGHTVINSGIPGEVSTEGLTRLAEELEEYQPNLVILCHGGNDLIRRLNKDTLRHNLEQMVTLIQDSGAQVVLVGVPNFNITLAVPDLYAEIAQQFNVPIEMEIIPSVERNPKLKSDTIHPNTAGYKQVAQDIHSLLLATGALTVN